MEVLRAVLAVIILSTFVILIGLPLVYGAVGVTARNKAAGPLMTVAGLAGILGLISIAFEVWG